MATEEQKPPEDREKDEGWESVGAAPASAASSGEGEAEEAYHVYGGKQPVPPWKLSRILAILGILIMAVLYFFPELRRFNAPWDPAYPTAYFALLLPIFALLWGFIGLVGKQFQDDRKRCWSGLILSVVAIGMAYGVMVTDPGGETDAGIGEDDRLDMTGEELQEWRSEKLNR